MCANCVPTSNASGSEHAAASTLEDVAEGDIEAGWLPEKQSTGESRFRFESGALHFETIVTSLVALPPATCRLP